MFIIMIILLIMLIKLLITLGICPQTLAMVAGQIIKR